MLNNLQFFFANLEALQTTINYRPVTENLFVVSFSLPKKLQLRDSSAKKTNHNSFLFSGILLGNWKRKASYSAYGMFIRLRCHYKVRIGYGRKRFRNGISLSQNDLDVKFVATSRFPGMRSANLRLKVCLEPIWTSLEVTHEKYFTPLGSITEYLLYLSQLKSFLIHRRRHLRQPRIFPNICAWALRNVRFFFLLWASQQSD